MLSSRVYITILSAFLGSIEVLDGVSHMLLFITEFYSVVTPILVRISLMIQLILFLALLIRT